MTERKNAAFEAVARLAQSVDLTDVRPIAFSARLISDPPLRGSRFTVDVRPRLTWQRSNNAFSLIAHFRLRARIEGERDRAFAQASYRVVAHYRWEDGADPSEETLRDFAGTNGMLNLWPYFRAFVTNSWAQLGLEPFVLPVFRVKARPPADPEGPASKERASPRRPVKH